MAKKDDPNYEQIRAHVPRNLVRRFKQYCLDEDIDYSEGLEEVLAFFFTALDGANKNPLKKPRWEPN